MLLKLLLLFISLVLFVGCGDAAPKPQIQEKEVSKIVNSKLDTSLSQKPQIQEKEVLKEEKTVGIWNSKSNANLSQREYDQAIKVYVDKKYPEKVEAYNKEIIRQAKIERERQAKIERERQAKIEREREREVREKTVSINGLMWQDNKEAKTIQRTFENAKKYCRNLSLVGFNDWRVPSKIDLESIVDTSRKPAIDKKFKNISSSYYWSSTSDANYSNGAWGVGFGSGYSGYGNKSRNYYVRCVRGGQ